MNKQIKLYQLKNINDCNFKAYISQFNFKTIQNKSSAIRKVYDKIIQDYDFVNLTETTLKIIIQEQLDDTYFLTKQEKEVEEIIILKHMIRYITYENKLDRKILSKKINDNVIIGENEIDVKADIIFENDNNIELVKYRTGATSLSAKARTEKNLPQNDMELFLLKKLGEQLYSENNKPIISSFVHLKGKKDEKDSYKQFLDDKSILMSNVEDLSMTFGIDKKAQKVIDKQIKDIMDILDFNNSTGNNIITFDYNNDLSDKIIGLANTKLTSDSEKCISSDCEFCNYSTLCNHRIVDKNEFEEVKEIVNSKGDVILTDAQKSVVDVEFGNYRVNASAGSGKSSTVVKRVVKLFNKGYTPQQILMITFTNKGAEELKSKIKNLINTKDLNIFTFNGFGENVISKEWELLGFTQQPQLASKIDINDTIKELLEEYDKIEWLNYKNPLINFPNAKGAFVQLINYFNTIKSFNYDVNSLIKNVLIKENQIDNLDELRKKAFLIFDLYGKFNSKLREKNLLQYQDQILYLIELLESDDKLLFKYGYSHIIVDEFQDTNPTQVKLLHILLKYKEYKSFMVVGDEKQSIFGFNNTTPENILNFHNEFENVKDICLNENFRSTPQICNVANKLSSLNERNINNDMISKKADGKLPQLLKFKTLSDENKYITELIEDKVKCGVPKHEICYIARTKKELLEVQGYLNDKNIDNIVEASELYLDNTSVQTIINLASFFRNTDLDYYLMEYMSISVDKFTELTLDETKDYVKEIQESIMCDFSDIETKEEYKDIEQETKIKYFNNLVIPIIESDKIAKSFMENINNKVFHSFNQFLIYLNKVMLYKDDTSIEKDNKKMDCVVLTTGHSSKGKEWTVVINSINKYKYEGQELDSLEEERRLLFVSITRAKQELYISLNTSQDKARSKGKYCKFADELKDIEIAEL